MSRFECERWIEVLPISVNPHNANFAFDVDIPKKVRRGKQLDYVLSLTNETQTPLSVPEYLLEGCAISYYVAVYYPSGKMYDGRYGPQKLRGYRAIPDYKHTLLNPGQKRETPDEMIPSMYSGSLPNEPGHYRLVFHWEGFLNENDWNELSRFTCEKFVEITQ